MYHQIASRLELSSISFMAGDSLHRSSRYGYELRTRAGALVSNDSIAWYVSFFVCVVVISRLRSSFLKQVETGTQDYCLDLTSKAQRGSGAPSQRHTTSFSHAVLMEPYLRLLHTQEHRVYPDVGPLTHPVHSRSRTLILLTTSDTSSTLIVGVPNEIIVCAKLQLKKLRCGPRRELLWPEKVLVVLRRRYFLIQTGN
ncbi:hypothetical protein BDV93DRAFT_216362 [Ceratobasidium sp. AG-I]|nr:hypothetical protein BDV93DRAFT_216362 [Ceratobasidium sp. AG-I]